MTPGHTGAGRAKALEAADLRRKGLSFESIGRICGITGPAVRFRLQNGCPALVGWPISQPRPPREFNPRPVSTPPPLPEAVQRGERPLWSYPDPITMRLVREAKEEMKREEWRSSG